MSAFLSSCDALSALATYWSESIKRSRFTDPVHYLNSAIFHGSGNLEYLDARTKAECLLDGRPVAVVIFELLLAENQASLAARYPADLEYRSAEGYAYEMDFDVQRSVVRNRTGWIVGVLDGYEYQACEHGDWHQSIGYELCQQMRRFLCDDLRRLQDPEGKQHFWAGYSRGDASASTTVPV
jgi:hypothetical protein